MPEPILVAWSSGKDSALALQEIETRHDFQVTLLSTVTEGYRRVSMHGVREQLLRAQAESLTLPLEIVTIPQNCTDEEYRKRMKAVLAEYRRRGCRRVAFGDIYLQDVREYRENNLSEVDMQALFPLWQRSPQELSSSFLQRGFRAVTTCVDSQALDRAFVGRIYDESFLDQLPAGVDPCGENGEFHTFVFDGPIFRKPVAYHTAEVVLRDNRYYFCDLIAADQAPKASTSDME